MTSLPWWLSVLIMLLLLSITRLAFRALRRRLEPSTDLFEPLHEDAFFCPNGHYLGRQEPEPHTLCQRCIDEGFYKCFCEIDEDTPHELPIVFNRPPFVEPCPQHGKGRTRYKIDGRPVSAAEWWQHNAPIPMEIPMPKSDPLPDELVEAWPGWGFAPDMSKSFLRALYDPAVLEDLKKRTDARQKELDRLAERVGKLEDDIEDRVEELEDVAQQRHRELTNPWTPILSIIGILLLTFLYIFPLFFVPEDSSETLIDTLASTTGSILEFLVVILIIFAILLLVLRFYKGRPRKIDLPEIIISFILAEILAVLLFPLIFGVSMTFNDIMQALTFDFFAEVIVLIVGFLASQRKLRQQVASLNKDLRLAAMAKWFLQSLSGGLWQVMDSLKAIY